MTKDRKFKIGQHVEYNWKGQWFGGHIREPHPDFIYDPTFYDIDAVESEAMCHIPEKDIREAGDERVLQAKKRALEIFDKFRKDPEKIKELSDAVFKLYQEYFSEPMEEVSDFMKKADVLFKEQAKLRESQGGGELKYRVIKALNGDLYYGTKIEGSPIEWLQRNLGSAEPPKCLVCDYFYQDCQCPEPTLYSISNGSPKRVLMIWQCGHCGGVFNTSAEADECHDGYAEKSWLMSDGTIWDDLCFDNYIPEEEEK